MLDQLDIFYGDTTDSMAHVYARFRSVEDPAGLSLAGRVRGPFCQYNRTLPSTTVLQDLGPGKGLLARATIPDPCCWSPEVPSLYQVKVELKKGNEIIVSTDRPFGIRRFGGRGTSLYLNGRRWVLRGSASRDASCDELTEWRDAVATLVVDQPNDTLCELASQLGVLVVARLQCSNEELVAQLRRLSCWAAVGMVLIPAGRAEDADLSDVAPNILLAQLFESEAEVRIAKWANVVAGRVDSAEQFAEQFAKCELPVIAVGDYDDGLDVAGRRAACDHLQRDLAAWGDFAGYVV